MAEVCCYFCIPAFVHKCLGAVERVHRTMAERLTPYMNSKLNNWIDVLPCITFLMNQSFHSDSKYSPHEIIFGQIPKFPLSPVTPLDFDTIPLDLRTFVRKHAERLNIIHSEIKNNILTSQQKMLERANKNSNPLHVKEDDYVFLTVERTSLGQEIQSNFRGPFVIHRCVSPHMYLLRNPENGRIYKSEVHLDRMRMAYAQEPDPLPYFLSKLGTAETVPPEKVTQATPGNGKSKEDIHWTEVISSHHTIFAPVWKVKIAVTKFKFYKKVQGFVETLHICNFKMTGKSCTAEARIKVPSFQKITLFSGK